jgi:diacylglycerol O-acyltransferase
MSRLAGTGAGRTPEAAAAGVPAGARPLSQEDLAILAIEDGTVAGHTGKVVLLAGEIELAALRASVASRLDQAPELRLRLGQVAGTAWWVPEPEVDLGAQIVLACSPAAGDEYGLLTVVADVFRQHLDRSRPLWRMDLVPGLPGGGSALIWRIHHALADGAACMRLAREVLWDVGAGVREPSRSARAGNGTRASTERRASTEVPRADGEGAATGADASTRTSTATGRHDDRPPGTWHRITQVAPRWLAGMPAVIRELPRPWLSSPFDGTVSGRRSVAFATASLAGVHRAAAAEEATVNDAVLSVIAGGLRRWEDLHHGRLGRVRVKVPVSLHAPGQELPARPGPRNRAAAGDRAGNRDSFFCLDLPLGPATPGQRLSAIRRETAVRKHGQDALLLDSFLARLAGHRRLRQLAERLLASPRSFALNVSNVRGPREPVAVLGVPVTGLYTLAEIRGRHALRISVVSLAGTLSFGFVADPTLLPDVDQLAANVQAEATALTGTSPRP